MHYWCLRKLTSFCLLQGINLGLVNANSGMLMGASAVAAGSPGPHHPHHPPRRHLSPPNFQSAVPRHGSLPNVNAAMGLQVKVKFLIDPLGQPKVTVRRDHCFRPCCPSIRLSRKTKQQKTILANGLTMGLAEWFIDDTCLVLNWIYLHTLHTFLR